MPTEAVLALLDAEREAWRRPRDPLPPAHLIDKELPNYQAGWFVTTLRKQSLEARARAVLGDYRRAVELFEPYAKPWRANTFISEAHRHLERLRAQAERAR